MQLLPDIEAFLYRYLSLNIDVDQYVAGRVYTRIPNAPIFPLIRITRVAGAPVYSSPLFLDAPLVQFDSFGGSSVQAWTIAETCRQAIKDLINYSDGSGLITAVEYGSFASQDDDSYDPPKPRYRFDATFYIRSV